MSYLTKIKRRRLYTPSNLPPSTQVALTRIKTLEVAVGEINVKLERPDFNAFETNYHFELWKELANKAMNHFQAEIDFLKDWVNQQNLRASVTIPERIETSIWWITENLKKKFQTRYTKGNLPANLTEAYKRKTELREISNTFKKIFEDLETQAKAAGVGRKRMSEAWKPLSDLCSEVMAERMVIKEYLHSNRADFRILMLSIIDRAIASGFTVTEEEAALLQDLKAETP